MYWGVNVEGQASLTSKMYWGVALEGAEWVGFTPRPLYSRINSLPNPFDMRLGWPQSRSEHSGEKNNKLWEKLYFTFTQFVYAPSRRKITYISTHGAQKGLCTNVMLEAWTSAQEVARGSSLCNRASAVCAAATRKSHKDS
jgi:hypothetical protein